MFLDDFLQYIYDNICTLQYVYVITIIFAPMDGSRFLLFVFHRMQPASLSLAVTETRVVYIFYIPYTTKYERLPFLKSTQSGFAGRRIFPQNWHQ